MTLKSYHKKLFSLFLSLLIFIQSLGPLLVLAGEAALSIDKVPASLEIPPELGHLESYHPGLNPQSPFVIHIQDLHASPQAQLKIKELLEWIEKNQKVKGGQPLLIGLEGAIGPLHPEYLDFFKGRPELNEEIVQDLLKKGELTGAELFAWEKHKQSKEKSVEFLGLEDPKLYKENLAAYRAGIFKQKEYESNLAPLRQDFETAKSRIFSASVQQFYREKQRRKDS